MPFTVRGLSVDLPALDELDRISSPDDLTGLVSDFEFSGVRVPALELKDVTLAAGRIARVRAGETSVTGAHVRSVEFAGCELGSLRWTGGKISRARFSDCQLAGARLEDVTVDHVVFDGCKLDYAMLSRVRAAGPVVFAGCSFREAEFDGCDLAGSLFDRCDLSLTGFGPGRYVRCDLRGNDLSAATGIHHLKRVVLDRAQLMQLAEALAAELDVDFGADPDRVDAPSTR